MEELDILVNEYKTNGGTGYQRRRIRDLAFIYIYGMPERKVGLTEDDAGTLVLEMSGVIERALDMYQPGRLGFSCFLKRLLRMKVRALLRRRVIRSQKEQAILSLHCFWENSLDELDRQEEAFDLFGGEEADSWADSLTIRRMKYLFSKNASVKRRFFIYACRLMPLMSVDIVENICTTLGFDLKQTMAISDLIWKRSRAVIEENEKRREKRNCHWQKQTAMEVAQSDNHFLADEETATEKGRRAEFHRERLRRSNGRLESGERMLVIPCETVGKVLNIAEGTVSSSCHYSRRMLEFCSGTIPLEDWDKVGKLKLDARDIIRLKSGLWEDSDCGVAEDQPAYGDAQAQEDEMFMPYTQFGIAYIEKCGKIRRRK